MYKSAASSPEYHTPYIDCTQNIFCSTCTCGWVSDYIFSWDGFSNLNDAITAGNAQWLIYHMWKLTDTPMSFVKGNHPYKYALDTSYELG